MSNLCTLLETYSISRLYCITRCTQVVLFTQHALPSQNAQAIPKISRKILLPSKRSTALRDTLERRIQKYWIIENKARWRASFRKASLWTETHIRPKREKNRFFCVQRKHFFNRREKNIFSTWNDSFENTFIFQTFTHAFNIHLHTHEIDFRCVWRIGQGNGIAQLKLCFRGDISASHSWNLF